jgi:hypothetical protein
MKPISGFVFSAPGLQFQILEKINPLQQRGAHGKIRGKVRQI